MSIAWHFFVLADKLLGARNACTKNQDPELRPYGVTPAPVQLQGHVVESTDRFTYLGSDIHSSERSTPEILRRIGLASNIFGRLANIWKRTGLSLQAKIRLYDALVISVLLYGSETWTLLKADERRLEALIANDGS